MAQKFANCGHSGWLVGDLAKFPLSPCFDCCDLQLVYTINWYLFLAQKWFLSQNLLHRKLHFLSQGQQPMKEWRKNWRCILAETKLIKVIKNCHQLLRYLGRYIQEGTFDFIGSKDICWTGHFNKSFYNLSSHTLDGEVEHFLLRYCTYVWSLWGPHHRTRLKVPSTYLRSESRDPTK